MKHITVKLTEDQVRQIIDDMKVADPNYLFLEPFRVRIVHKLNKALAQAKS